MKILSMNIPNIVISPWTRNMRSKYNVNFAVVRPWGWLGSVTLKTVGPKSLVQCKLRYAPGVDYISKRRITSSRRDLLAISTRSPERANALTDMDCSAIGEKIIVLAFVVHKVRFFEIILIFTRGDLRIKALTVSAHSIICHVYFGWHNGPTQMSPCTYNITHLNKTQ